MNKHEERMLDLALEEVVGGAQPPDLSDRIARAVCERSAASPIPRPSRLAAAILVAAAVLMGALVLWKIVATSATPQPSPVPASTPSREKTPPKQDPAALRKLADELEKEALEGNEDLHQRAQAFLKVAGPDDAVARARYKAAWCFRADAFRKWAKNPQDPAAREGLVAAEEALVKLLAQQGDPARNPLLLLARYELAMLSLHEAVHQPEKALDLLDQCAKGAPPADPWLARVWAGQISCHLDAKRLDPAVQILDRLLEKFPDGPEAARASKMTAIRLDEATWELIRSKSDPGIIDRNLRKVSKYYVTWINLGPVFGMKITTEDVLSVAETLYMNARRINGLDDGMITFADLRGKKIAEPGFFADAAIVHAMLVGAGNHPVRTRIQIGARRARCLAFAAVDQKGWKDAAQAYQELLDPFNLLKADGTLDPAVLQAHRELLGIYFEMGCVQGQVGPLFDGTPSVFGNVLRVVLAGSEPWWNSKYMVLEVLYRRGTDSDLRLARTGLQTLEQNAPDFDGGRFGMKDRFVELKKKIDDALKR